MFGHQHLHPTNISMKMSKHKNEEKSQHHNIVTTSINLNLSTAMQNNHNDPVKRHMSSEKHTTNVTKQAPRRYSYWQRSVLEKYYKQTKFIHLMEAIQLSSQLNMTQEQVKRWFSKRRRSERDKNVQSASSTKFFRPFLPLPVSESSNASTTSPVLWQSTSSSCVKNDRQTRHNTMESRSDFPIIPKKRWSAAFFRPFIDDSQLSSSQPVCNVITPIPKYKPELTKNDTPNMINRRTKFDRMKTGQELTESCEFSVPEFERFLQQNIKLNEQKQSPDNQLVYISVNYKNNHLMSIPIELLSGYRQNFNESEENVRLK